MKFLRINMENQFAPSNFGSSKPGEPYDDDDNEEYDEDHQDSQVRFKPMPKIQRKTVSGRDGFQAIHIESNEVHEFKIPVKPKEPPRPYNNNPRAVRMPAPPPNSDVDVEVIQEQTRPPPMPKPVEPDYNQFNYEHIELKSQTNLLWSGPHWQIEKLLMDITFAQPALVNVDDSGDTVLRTIVLNNGQDGSFKEYISKKQRKVTEIQYNYPDQSLDEHSSIAFSLRKIGQMYYLVIVITDFTVTLDAPINPQRFCVDYLRRVLHVGGTFTIDK